MSRILARPADPYGSDGWGRGTAGLPCEGVAVCGCRGFRTCAAHQCGMGSKVKRGQVGVELPAHVLNRRLGLYASGASGVHADQVARVHRAGTSRRVGSRAARVRAAVRNELG